MDVDSERKKLEDKGAFIASWLEHPLTLETTRDNEEQQQALIDRICLSPVDSIGTLTEHFSAIGELRGLRRARGITLASLEAVKEDLKNIQD